MAEILTSRLVGTPKEETPTAVDVRKSQKEKWRILILEDEEPFVDIYKAMLAQDHREYEFKWVVQKKDFEEALRTFFPHVVISDFQLPDFNGTAALKITKELAPRAEFILVSGVLSEDLSAELIRSGATDYVLKTNLKRFVYAVRNAIERHKQVLAKEQAEEFLKKSEAQFRLISENIADIITLLDESGLILYTSPSCHRILGFHLADLKDTSLFDLIHPDDVQKCKSVMLSVEEEFKSRSVEYRIRHKNGRMLTVESTISLLISDSLIQIVMASRNVTERVLRDEERVQLARQLQDRNEALEQTLKNIQQMQAQLVQSEKMASIGQLTAGIAHEINNPLSFVSSNLNRFEEYVEDTLSVLREWQVFGKSLKEYPQFQEALAAIQRAEQELDIEFLAQDFQVLKKHTREGTERIRSIVERLRGFAHMGNDKFVDANLNEAVDNTLSIVWNELKYKATVKKEYGTLPPVNCNPGEIEQVLVNLFVNAAHAIPEKGEIAIRTFVEGDEAVIQIADTGTGIASEHLKRIFDPFFTTKSVGKGTGLGLWICSTIIQKHQGTLNVESQVGRGTTFTIRLPIQRKRVNN